MGSALARVGALALGLATALAPVARAASDDPSWPCIQRKVPALAVAQMWSGPPPAQDWKADAQAQQLAARLAPRRTPLEDVEQLAAEFVSGQPPEVRAERLANVFAGVLATIDAERGQVIAGIARYARKQDDLAARVEQKRETLARLEAEPEPDLDRVEELQDTLAWDVRVFRERAQSLTYVCETPVLLEQRAFAIARTLAGLI